MRCRSQFRWFAYLFFIKDKHSFVISNIFSTLESQDLFDVIKTCVECGEKQVMTMDKVTLLEVMNKFPKAFNPLVVEYITSWMK